MAGAKGTRFLPDGMAVQSGLVPVRKPFNTAWTKNCNIVIKPRTEEQSS